MLLRNQEKNMKAKTCAAAMTLIGMSFGLFELAVAQTGPNAPREPAASGAIVVPPGTGDSETMQKAPPAVVDPRMATPPPAAGKDALPDTTRPQPIPGPMPGEKKKSPKPS
jgi:hypothetical protein